MEVTTVYLPIRYKMRNRLAYEVPYEENRNGVCRVFDKQGNLKSVISKKECAILETRFNRMIFSGKTFNTTYRNFDKKYGK